MAVARSKLGRPEEHSSEAQGGAGSGGRGWLGEGFICHLCGVDHVHIHDVFCGSVMLELNPTGGHMEHTSLDG